MNTDIFAAIDIGSNAIRLLINNIEVNGNNTRLQEGSLSPCALSAWVTTYLPLEQ